MTGDPLGVSGDFITSPEISQVFGEVRISPLGGLSLLFPLLDDARTKVIK